MSNSDGDGIEPESASPRSERIRAVVDEWLRRGSHAEPLAETQLLEDHPDLLPELAVELIRVRGDARSGPAQAGSGPAPTALHQPGAGRSLHIRCPHCHNRVEVLGDTTFSEITCTSCGSTFSILGRDTATDEAASLKSVAHFELISRLGLGSYGTVWKAHDTQLDRTVAIKIPRREELDPMQEEQFLREARAAAQLSHPNIVAVHEVGRDDDTLFIVSDLIRGVPLSEWLTVKRPTLREGAQLIAKVATALHHAHEQDVIHRDLKPSNVMIDGDDEPHVMDFGLAKREVGEVTLTIDGAPLGTPAYMSPEQARGEAHQTDRRTDVYSLGVMLFELITGELPFRGGRNMLIHQVQFDEPPSPRKFNARISRDLETICLKCLQKLPRHRYPTAADLAEELHRYLDGRPILARPISASTRAWRWCRRNPLTASFVVAVTSLLLFVAAGSTVAAFLINVEREQAEHAKRKSERLQRTADAERALAEQARRDSERLLYAADMNLIGHLWQDANVSQAMRHLVTHLPRSPAADLRGFEWYYWWRECNRHESALHPHAGGVSDFDVSRDGRTAASGGWDGAVHIHDLVDRQYSVMQASQGAKPIRAIEVLGEGPRILFARDSQDAVEVYDTRTARRIELSTSDYVQCAAARADGIQGGVACVNRTVHIWSGLDGVPERRRSLTLEELPLAMAFSPDGKELYVAQRGRKISIWDVESGSRTRSIEVGAAALTLTVSPDGNLVAVGDSNFRVSLFDRSGQFATTLGRHENYVRCLCFSPSGNRLASGGSDRRVNVWDVNERSHIGTIRGHGRTIQRVAFLAERRLITASSDGTSKTWDLDSCLRDDVVAFSSDPIVGISVGEHRVRALVRNRLNWSIGQVPLTSRVHGQNGESTKVMALLAQLSANGKHLATWTLTDAVQLWDTSDESNPRALTKTAGNVVDFAFSVGGDELAALSFDSPQTTIVRVWTTEGEMSCQEIRKDFGFPTQLTFTPSGSNVVIGTRDGDVHVVNRESGENWTIDAGKGMVTSIAFSSSGRYLATAVSNSAGKTTMALWPFRQDARPIELGAHLDVSETVFAFSHDERTLVSGGGDSELKFWDVATGMQKGSLEAHVEGASCLAFSSDDRTLVAGYRNGTVRIWRAASDRDFERQWNALRRGVNRLPIAASR